MKSPVNVLWNNIVHRFENINSISLSAHRSAIESGKISDCINYYDDKEKIKTPSASLTTREINIQETYLSHLWSFMYSILVMYEEGVQKPMLNNTFNGSLEFNSPLLKRAKLLFDWSISLTSKYSVWDERLPNPRNHNSDEEKYYVEKVNSLFQDAVVYVMFHEFAHLTQNHDSFFLNKVDRNLVDLIQLENEADKFAFNMLENNDDENQRLIKGISMLSVFYSALLIVPYVEDIKQEKHPDLDNRIISILQQLNLNTEENKFYCWYLSCIILRLFLLKHNIELLSGEFDTAQDAFYYYLDELDKFKS